MRRLAGLCVALLAAGLGQVAWASGGRPTDPAGRLLPDKHDALGIPKSIIDKRDLGGPRPPEPARQSDPLESLSGQMGDIVNDLAHLHTDKPVQDKQARVVKALDELIKAIEDSQNSGQGNGAGRSGNRPRRPMSDSRIAGGPGGIGDLNAPKASRKEWGQLPPKQREQILQSKTEGFPPGFESVLQSYYRRLAQEQVLTPAPPQPAEAETTP